MEDIDLKLIKLLQEDARISITDLSREVNLSRPSVKERVTRLVEKGVIQRFSAVIAPKKVGKEISFYVQISHLKVMHDVLISVLEKKDCVVEMHAVTGDSNYILKCHIENIDCMNAFLEELLTFGRIETSVILNSPINCRNLIPGKIKLFDEL